MSASLEDRAHKDDALRNLVLEKLQGRLWHTTHPDRFRQILLDGAILTEPALPESERWKTSKGREFYPYVRIFGGISLFDFNQFNSVLYDQEYPLSSWYTFVPYQSAWKRAVWIEIDRPQIANGFVSGSDLVKKWKAANAYRHTFMPIIEAASLRSIPCSAFLQVFSVCEESSEIELINFSTTKGFRPNVS